MAPPPDEERVRSILEVKEYVAKKIEEHEAEIEMLRRNLELLDSTLTKSSFAKASDLLRGGGAGGGRAEAAAAKGGGPAEADSKAEEAAADPGAGVGGGRREDGTAEMTSISGPGGQVLARAHVTDDRVSIVMAAGVHVDAESDQIQEFLLGKVVGRMKREDAVGVEEGRIEAGQTVEAKVESDGARLVSVTVSNYRERERSNEIVGTARWAINQLVDAAALSAAPAAADPQPGAGQPDGPE